MQAHVEAHAASDPIRHNSGERYFSYDVVETGFSTSPIPAPPYVPPTRVVRTVATSATDTGLQPALRLSPPGEELSCTVRHFVYYPDPVTIQMHAQAAVNAGWGGVVLWALGYETPGVYTALAATTP
jgi:hypothetical protein